MRKEAKRSFQPFEESQEAIEAKINYEQQNCSTTEIISTSIDSFTKDDSNSSDLMDDASSFTSSSSNGPLYQLSDLMDQLPIKRGLSKYYQGKSESFARLASVEKLEDLVKRENPYRKRIKLSKNNSSGCFGSHKFCSPKPTIAKKTTCYSRGCFSLSSKLARNTTSNLMSSCRLQDF